MYGGLKINCCTCPCSLHGVQEHMPPSDSHALCEAPLSCALPKSRTRAPQLSTWISSPGNPCSWRKWPAHPQVLDSRPLSAHQRDKTHSSSGCHHFYVHQQGALQLARTNEYLAACAASHLNLARVVQQVHTAAVKSRQTSQQGAQAACHAFVRLTHTHRRQCIKVTSATQSDLKLCSSCSWGSGCACLQSLRFLSATLSLQSRSLPRQCAQQALGETPQHRSQDCCLCSRGAPVELPRLLCNRLAFQVAELEPIRVC